MKTATSALATLVLLGGAAMAQTAVDSDAGTATAPGEETTESGTPLVLPQTGTDPSDPVDTDATASGDSIEMDGTVPVDVSPDASATNEESATDATEGGTSAGPAVDPASGEVSTDATATGNAMTMDGTVPVDESIEAGEGASPDGPATTDTPQSN